MLKVIFEVFTHLELLFPALMVIGAVGSFAVEMIRNGYTPTALQWFGAAMLYTALLLRNM